MTGATISLAADAAYGRFYPLMGMAVAEGKQARAWRGDVDKNPMLRPLRAALALLDEFEDVKAS